MFSVSANTPLADYVREVYVRNRIKMRPRSAEQLYVACNALSEFLDRRSQLSDLTEDTIVDFLRAYSEVYADATVNKKRGMLLQIWREAYRRKHLRRPVPDIPKIQERLPMPTAWTPAEVSRVLKAARQEQGRIDGIRANLWFVSLCLALLDTGARIGALRLTRQADIRLDDPAGVMLISEFSKVKRPEWRPLHQQTIDVVKQAWFPERELMWPWPHHRSWLFARFKKICERANVPHGKGKGGLFYLFRRTSGTLAEAHGGDGSKQLGNGRDVFARYYFDQRHSGRGQLDFIPRPEF